MTNAWLERWQNNQIGWHQAGGHASIERYWKPQEGAVLVPLCGKAHDLFKLNQLGLSVTGVELSDKAAREFFRDHALEFDRVSGRFPEYIARSCAIRIVVADFFDFSETGFSAVFDRAALIALPPDVRPSYARHLQERLQRTAFHLLVSLEYAQEKLDGPPFSVLAAEIEQLHPELVCVDRYSDIDNSPPKFAAAGIDELVETIWVSDVS